MENLRAWLNGCRDYASGAALYNEHGPDQRLKQMFAEAETPFKKQRLEKALEELWRLRPQTVVTPTGSFSIQPIAKPLSSFFDAEATITKAEEPHKQMNGWPVKMDDVLLTLHTQWKASFLQMVDLQSRLYEVGRAGRTDKAREREAGTIALKILDLRDAVNDFYGKRDHYLKNGRLPEAPAPVADCLDPKLYGVKLQNAQRYVREYKAKLATLGEGDDKHLRALQQVQKWQAEVDKFKTLLNLT